MTRKRTNNTRRPLNKFIDALLEPLPEAELVDTHHNFLLRQARWKEWRKAAALTEYYRALHALNHAEGRYHREIIGDDSQAQQIWHRLSEISTLWREAEALQIMTPAPDRSAVTWKRKTAADKRPSLSAEIIAAMIAEDETWLTAHPIRRPAKPLQAA